MQLSLIAAIASNGVIGRTKTKELLWHLPDDFKHFKTLTMGKPIIMGRTTYESIGRLLPGRTNIILTRQPYFKIEGAQMVHSVYEAQEAAAATGAEEAMIIGGSHVYHAFLPLVDKLYMTEIHTPFEGDVLFPDFDRSMWRETARATHPADDRHAQSFDFVTLERNQESKPLAEA